MSFKMQFFVILSISISSLMFHSVDCDILPPSQEKVIVNGYNAAEGQFPYECALFFQDQFVCGSTIISDQDLITAAHCIVIGGNEQDASQFHAICNVDKSASEYRVDFSRVTIHPDYNSETLKNDLAIFEASEPIHFSETVNRICIARSDTGMDEYSEAVAMGWGQTDRDDAGSTSDILQYIEQTIVNNYFCGLLIDEVTGDKICAGGFFNGICLGDSGGALVHLDEQADVLIGITSYINGYFPCGKLIPAVFTRVSSYTEYIMSVAKGDVCTV